jgi:hypothetical protein
VFPNTGDRQNNSVHEYPEKVNLMAFWKTTVRPTSFAHSIPAAAMTPQQQAAVQHVCGTPRNCVVAAVAGAGKTTWAVHLCDQIGRNRPNASILFLAFQSDVKKALEAKIPTDAADVRTCHGCGYGFPARTSKVRLAQKGYSIAADPKWGDNAPLKKLHLDMGADADHLVKFFTAAVGDDKPAKKTDVATLCKLLSLSKNLLAGLVPHYAGHDLVKLEKDPASVKNIIEQFGLEFSEYTSVQDAAELVIKAMEWSRQGPANVTVSVRQGKFVKGQRPTFAATPMRAINCDDQLWLPIINGWTLPQYDVVIVDEAQDLSPARLAIVRLSVKPGGQLIAVGDEFQAIFGFAGADCQSLPKLIEEFKCEVLPMTWTQRCARLIVNEARKVDERLTIEARPDADEGIVDTVEAKELFQHVKAGDAIISRTNAPLIALFFQLARQGKRVVMLGKDYGAMLAHRIKGYQAAAARDGVEFDGHALLSYNRSWYAARIESLGEGKAAAKERAFDEACAIKALTFDLTLSDSNVGKLVIERCYNLFSNDHDGKGTDAITLASTHKFKGDERNRVFCLAETYLKASDKQTSDEAQQEKNLLYVAITRAKKHLSYVTGLKSSRQAFGEESPL